LRSAEFSQLFSDTVQGVERPSPQLLRLRLRPAPQVAARVAELVSRETQCCSFFRMVLRFSENALVLEMGVPAGNTGMLDAIAATATRMSSATTSAS